MKLFRTSAAWYIEREGSAATLAGFELAQYLAAASPSTYLAQHLESARPSGTSIQPSMAPIDSQEVWAAGVTYLRSKTARMAESQSAATAYDKVYDAPRPEIFFKATPRRCAGPGQPLRLRDDSNWMVPEPELTLVVSAAKHIVGFTLGNDLSCRDIEGENTLYLPQAKMWDACCGLGPAILINDGSFDIRQSEISVEIVRGGKSVFQGATPVARIKRSFEELVSYLFRNQSFPDGVFLLTGTGIVPADDFTLKPGDQVSVTIPEIGTLTNDMR